MKIVQINAVYRFGSTGRSCEELAKKLAENGDECITVYGEKRGSYTNTIYMGNLLDHKLHALLSRMTGKVGYFSTIPTLNLIKQINQIRPDIVHLRVLHSNFINIPLLLDYLKRNSINTVITLDDCFWFTGKCCHFYSYGCEKWKTHCKECEHYKEWNKSWFFDRTRAMFKDKIRFFADMEKLKIVGVSNWISDLARESRVFKGCDIRTIYNGIDTSVFKPCNNSIKEQLGIEDKKMILGVASDWSELKGIEDFFDLYSVIPEDFCIVLIGEISDKYSKPEGIINIPRITSPKELAKYYSAANVFLQLSKQETFGKVSVEALACGTPVISYDFTASPEVVGMNCGIIIQRDRQILLNAILKICDENKSKFSENCVRWVNENYTIETWFSQYYSLFKEFDRGKIV